MRRSLMYAGIAMLVLYGAARWFGGARAPVVEQGSTLVVELAGSYVEAPEPSLVGRLLGQPARPFVGLLSKLAIAERDDRLKTVVLHIEGLGIGWGKAQELRRAIGRLREAGRHTIACLEVADFRVHREYFVASAADEIYLVPGGFLPLVGLAAEYTYLGGLWEKLGVEFDVARVGRYKSAVESIAGTGMSEASREMADALLDSTEQQFVAAIAQGRGLSLEAVRTALDSGPVLAAELVERDLIDGQKHLSEITDGIGAPIVETDDYARVDPASVGFDPVSQYALVYGSGTVQGGDSTFSPSGDPVFSAKAVSRALRDAAEADDIDGIILRIDSPGGSALASEIIWRAVAEAKESSGKPIVASFSDVAASGGYYVASGADVIVAPGASLTGSIGVFALRPVLAGFLDKIGIGVESLTRGRHADFITSAAPLSEGGRERLQSFVDDVYALFLQRVSEGRSLDRDAVHAVAQGRVWTAEQALEHGLVDALGGLHEAVEEANSLRGLDRGDDAVLVAYPPPKGLAQEIAELLNARALPLLRTQLVLPEPLVRLQQWFGSLPSHTPLLVPPAIVDIH